MDTKDTKGSVQKENVSLVTNCRYYGGNTEHSILSINAFHFFFPFLQSPWKDFSCFVFYLKITCWFF